MIGMLKPLVFLLLVLSQYADCQESVSWVFRGIAQQNNSVLTFNMGDTLNLLCVGTFAEYSVNFLMIISKGASPPSDVTVDYTGDYYEFTMSDDGILIYDDIYGIYPGYENFVVIPGPFQATYASGRDYRNIGVALLQPADAGTYHCTGRATYIFYEDIGDDSYGVYYSGALTLVVNTKNGQAKSAKTNANNFLAYSTLILSASKIMY